MFFSLSKIFWVMISPLNLLGICFVLVIILSAIRQRIYTKILCFFSVIFLFFGVMPVGHDALTFLENRFPKPREMPGQVDGIILLGGAISTELSYARGETVVDCMTRQLENIHPYDITSVSKNNQYRT